MFLTTLITTILNVLASDPITHLGNGLLLLLDRGVYQLVASAFSIFIIMSQMNLSSISNMAAFIVDRLKALIIVFVIFKVGVALINYMLNPDKAMQGSKKLLINILICAALLVSSNFIFTSLNELSMMIVGKPESYKYTVLKQVANVTDEGDDGLIMRLFFGKSDTVNVKNSDDIGNNLAFQSLCVTFPDMDNKSSCTGLKATIGDGTGGMNIKKLNNINAKLDKTVDGHPGIALILGLYIVYSVVLASIDIGVRMFKLMLLQLVSPIAIIFTASEEGLKADKFKKFVSTYVQVYISAFTRIISILLVTVFVSKIFGQLDTILGEVKEGNNHSMWVLIICIVAGYRFANELPKLIDSIFATHMGDSAGSGFGKFMAGLVAAPVLGAAGLATGISTGVATGSVGGAVVGGLSGLGSGMAAGFKGNTIADKMKAGADARAGTRARVTDISNAGGVLPWAYGGVMQPFKGGQDAKVSKFDNEISQYDEVDKLMSDYTKYRANAIKDDYVGKAGESYAGFNSTITSMKYGADKGSFISAAREHNTDYLKAKADYQNAVNNKANATELARLEQEMMAKRNASDKAASGIWEARRNAVPEDKQAEQMRAQINTRLQKLGIEGHDDKGNTYKSLEADNVKDSSDALSEALRTSSDSVRAQKLEYTDSRSYKATHRDGGSKK